MKLYIGSDHAGFYLKNYLYQNLKNDFEIEDLGPAQLDVSDDYPDIAIKMGETICDNQKNYGILVCKNGVGVCIASNKVDNIRAVNTISKEIAKSSRTDDNTNILCIGAGYITELEAIELVKEWLNTDFSNDERHVRRIEKINNYENK